MPGNFVRATQPIEKAADDSYSVANGDPVYFNFTNVLPSGVTITSVTSTEIDKSTTPALTIANAAATSGAYVDPDGVTVAAAHAVEADCSGGKEETNYVVTVVVGLSNGSDRGGEFPVHVR